MRGISAEGNPFADSLWLAVGDSLPVSVHESRCQYDYCSGEMLTVSDSLWTLDDTSIAGVRTIVRPPDVVMVGAPSVQLVGRRPGHATLRIALPPLASDSAPSSSPPERVLKREVVVTRPLVRIELLPRPDGVRVGETIQLRVRAIDDQGRAYENPPVCITVSGGAQPYIQVATSPLPLTFDVAGTRTVVARFRSLADTLALGVLPAPR